MSRQRQFHPDFDRRSMPRVAAPIIYRRSGLDLFHHQRSSVDISTEGIRVLSDEPLNVGDQLELDLLPPDEPAIRVWARVAWVDDLPTGEGAPYEIGLQFTDIAAQDRSRLGALLVRLADEGPTAAAGDP